jgi:hypothetical protein
METTEIKNTPFFKKITGNNESIKGARAALLSQNLEGSMATLVSQRKSHLNSLLLKKESMLDFSPSQTTSLKFQDGSFDAEAFALELEKLQLQIVEAEVRHQAALDNYNSLFKAEEA